MMKKGSLGRPGTSARPADDAAGEAERPRLARELLGEVLAEVRLATRRG